MSHPINPISTLAQYADLTDYLANYGITLDDRRVTNNYDDNEINTLMIVSSSWHQVRGGVQIDLLLAGGEQFIIWDTFSLDAHNESNHFLFARTIWSVSPVKYYQTTGKHLAVISDEFMARCSGQGSSNSQLFEFGEYLDQEIRSDLTLPLWITRGFQVVSDWTEEIRRS